MALENVVAVVGLLVWLCALAVRSTPGARASAPRGTAGDWARRRAARRATASSAAPAAVPTAVPAPVPEPVTVGTAEDGRRRVLAHH